jgi:HEAT repeat protein
VKEVRMDNLIPCWDLEDIGLFTYEHFTKKIKRPFTEDTMIDILIKQPHWSDLFQAVVALRKIGTEKSIEYLKNVTLNYNGTKKIDIQGNAVLTIAKLANGMENEFFGKLLLNENYRNKWYAMAAIFYKNNDKALIYVLEYGINKI